MKTLKPEKRAHGTHYEKQACELLERLNYRILCQNFSVRSGEIDIVAEERRNGKTTLIIVEVRKKEKGGWIRPEESITWKKQKRILSALQFYLQRYRGQATEVRIDLIGYVGEAPTHFKDFIPAG